MNPTELEKVLEETRRLAEQAAFDVKRRRRKAARAALVGVVHILKVVDHEDEALEAIRQGIEDRPLRRLISKRGQRIFPARVIFRAKF